MTGPIRFIGLAICLAAPARAALAQLGCAGARCTVEITMPVTDILRLSINATSVALGTPTESDFVAGYRDVSGAAVNVTAKSNRPFSVQVSGATPSFGYTGGLPDPAKPATDLLWAASAAGLDATTTHMGLSGTFLNQGAGTITQPLFLRTRWDFVRDVPGTYSLAIRLTLSAP